MNYTPLSPQGESLLKEIIRQNNPKLKEKNYWKKRFEGLTMNERNRLRSVFEELIDAEYIKAGWSGYYPYTINVGNDGLNYFKYKKQFKRAKRQLTHRELLIAVVSVVLGALTQVVISALIEH